MKPVGPIPPGFACIAGELAIGGRRASELVAEAGRTPLFVYSRAMLDARMGELRAALPRRVGVNYAVKANPHPEVIAHMAPLVDGFDIASAGELRLCTEAGIDPRRISFASASATRSSKPRLPRASRSIAKARVRATARSPSASASASRRGSRCG